MRKRILTCCIISALCVLVLCIGCATTDRVKGVYHRVQPNETLSQIARAYGTTPEIIAAANNVEDINLIERDRTLFIPNVDGQRDASSGHEAVSRDAPAPVTGELSKQTIPPGRVLEQTLTASPPPETASPATVTETGSVSPEKSDHAKAVKPAPSKESPPAFLWPFPGKVTSRFGPQPGGTRLNGISLESVTRAPVIASESGTVLHSAPIKFYGETIIIRHRNDYLTTYSHMQSRTVQTGDQVSRGDTIGIPGKNDSNGNHSLYFEMRRNNRPIDPLSLLPKR